MPACPIRGAQSVLTGGRKAEHLRAMSRLSIYLSRQYAAHGLSLFVAVVFLVWINQTLKLFDLVTAKGQSLLTLFGQSILTTPPLSRATLYICVGIGIARTLEALQASYELHTIHATRRTAALWSSLLVTATLAALAVGLVAHWLEPMARKAYGEWTQQIAADLVSRALEPNRFSEIAPGFVVEIGGRLPDGTVTDFFANDSRNPDSRRTYQARRASINSDDKGLYLALRDGQIQNQSGDGSLTEVAFASYQIGLDSIAQTEAHRDYIDETSTFDFMRIAATRALTSYEVWNLESRWMEIPRVYAMCLLAMLLTGFPRGRQSGFRVPVEIVIVIIALLDRILSDQFLLFDVKGLLGVVLLLAAAGAVATGRRVGRYLPPMTGRPA